MKVKEGPVAGISFGTTNSCVAVYEAGNVVVIPNGWGLTTTPSMVTFTQTQCLVGGNIALADERPEAQNIVRNVKRLLGRSYNDPLLQEEMQRWAYAVRAAAGGDRTAIEVQYQGRLRSYTPEEICACVLAEVKAAATRHLGEPVTKAVITIPAMFSTRQREAVKAAGALAGLEVLRLLPETSAAAISYYLQQGAGQQFDQRTVLVVSMGGGCTDASLIDIDEGIFEVKASAGNTHLGGVDFNNRLVDHFVKEFARVHSKDIRANPRSLTRLRTACERAKHTLSVSQDAHVEMDSLYQGLDLCSSITRERFEGLCLDLFRDLMDLIKKVLRDANTDKGAVADVVLVGGSTCIPKVQQMLRDFFAREPHMMANPEEEAAAGAAAFAAILTGAGGARLQDFLLIDATPISFGINADVVANRQPRRLSGDAMVGGVQEEEGVFPLIDSMLVLIPRNTSVPTKKELIFRVTPPRQHSVLIQVYEGESALNRNNTLLGVLELPSVNPGPQGVAKLVITLDIDANAVLTVQAEVIGTGQPGEAGVKRSKQLENTEVQGCLSRQQIQELEQQGLPGR